jgi:hypothetical protein
MRPKNSLHPPVIHKNNFICRATRKPHLMRDANHRHAIFGQIFHHLQHLHDHFWVQRRSGLVKQHDFRPHAKRPRNRHPLLLPT